MNRLKQSTKFALNRTDITKIGTGLLIATTGAGLTYLSEVVTQTNFTVNYNGVAIDLTPAAVIFWSVFANTVRKYLQGK